MASRCRGGGDDRRDDCRAQGFCWAPCRGYRERVPRPAPIGDVRRWTADQPPDAPQSGGVLGAVKDKPCRARKRASLTAPARAAVKIARVGTKKRASSRTKKLT